MFNSHFAYIIMFVFRHLFKKEIKKFCCLPDSEVHLG